MERQVYKIAAMAIAGLMALGTSGFAQQSSGSVPAAPATTSTPPTAAVPAPSAYGSNNSYSFSTPAPAQVYVGQAGNYAFESLGIVQDSAYRKNCLLYTSPSPRD